MARAGAFGRKAASVLRAAALCVFVLTLTASAQDATPTLHVYTNLVQIPTLVLDQDSHPVPALPEGRFFISIDGGPQFRVTHVRPEGDDPISLAVVLDVSQPFPALMSRFDEALASLPPLSLHPRDRVSVYVQDCDLTRSAAGIPAEPAALKHAVDVALERWKTRGRERQRSTCKQPLNLWDSLSIVSGDLSTQPGRRVILAVTDGIDRGSKTTWNELRRAATRRAEAIFGLVQPSDTLFHARREVDFNSVCQMTGGIIMSADGNSLHDQLKQFTAMLRSRYIVEFPHPVDTVGGEHGMEVTIRGSDAVILPAGIGIPLDDPAILKDPTTIPTDAASAPQLGKRKILNPH